MKTEEEEEEERKEEKIFFYSSKINEENKQYIEPYKYEGVLGVDREGVSLGLNCQPAILAVNSEIRSKKINGYKTCPFDELVSNYKGIINCINDDFRFFLNVDLKKCNNDLIKFDNKYYYNNLFLNQNIIYNKTYKFIFSHESPIDSVYTHEKWEKGINHYIIDNYKEFKIRYKRRIHNFKELLTSGKKIDFLLMRSFINGENDISLLYKTIQTKYPSLDFKIVLLDINKYSMYIYLMALKIDKNDDEVKRLFINTGEEKVDTIETNNQNNKGIRKNFKKFFFMN